MTPPGVVGPAVRLRFGGVEAAPRSFLWGRAVRRIALIGLLVQAVGATVMVVQDAWIAGLIRGPAVPAQVLGVAQAGGPMLVELVAAAAWVAALFALVLGSQRAAKVLAAAALATAVAGALGDTARVALGADPASLVLTTWAQLLFAAVLVLALAAFHRDAPGGRARLWLIAYLVGLPIAAAPQVLFMLDPAVAGTLVDQPGVWCVAVAVAAGVCLARHRRHGLDPGWALAFALLAGGVLALRVVSLLGYALNQGGWLGQSAIAIGVAQAVAVTAVAAPLAVLARRSLRDLPPASPERSA